MSLSGGVDPVVAPIIPRFGEHCPVKCGLKVHHGQLEFLAKIVDFILVEP